MTKELTVPFHEDSIRIVIADDGAEFVPMKALCATIGLDWERQRRGLKASSKRWGTVYLDTPSASGEQVTTCIPRFRVGGWLYSIPLNLVNEATRDRLIRYQQELDVVIDRYLSGQHAAETAELRQQVAKLRAFCLAFNPLWAKVKALQEAGVWSNMVRHHVRKPIMDVQSAITQMEQTGIISEARWADYGDATPEVTHG